MSGSRGMTGKNGGRVGRESVRRGIYPRERRSAFPIKPTTLPSSMEVFGNLNAKSSSYFHTYDRFWHGVEDIGDLPDYAMSRRVSFAYKILHLAQPSHMYGTHVFSVFSKQYSKRIALRSWIYGRTIQPVFPLTWMWISHWVSVLDHLMVNMAVVKTVWRRIRDDQAWEVLEVESRNANAWHRIAWRASVWLPNSLFMCTMWLCNCDKDKIGPDWAPRRKYFCWRTITLYFTFIIVLQFSEKLPREMEVRKRGGERPQASKGAQWLWASTIYLPSMTLYTGGKSLIDCDDCPTWFLSSWNE